MRTKKNEKWKIILAVLVALLLIKCTYIAFIGDLLLPNGLIWQLSAVNDEAEGNLKLGSIAVIDTNSEVKLPAVIAWEKDGKCSFGVGTGLDGEKIKVGYEKTQLVESTDLIGRVTYTISWLGYITDWLQRYGAVVLAADFLFIAAILFYLAAEPKRREAARREELIRTFKLYGDKYDLEDAGIDY